MMRKLGFVLVAGAHCLMACSSDDSNDQSSDPVSEPDAGATDETDTTGETEGTETATVTDMDGEEPDSGAEPPDGGAEGTDEEVPDGGVEALSGEGGVDIEVEAGGPTFSVTGRIKVGDTLFVDTDTPNIDNPVISNNEFSPDDPSADEAQLISSPSTVGGYIGPLPVLDDQGEPTGETTPDDRDAYRVTLAQGQVVTLFTAEQPDEATPAADLDLFLLETSTGTIVSDSQGAGDKEQVIAPSTGDFWVVVDRYVDENEPEDGQAIYSLAVGIAQPTAVQQSINMQRLTTDWEAVPGQAVGAMGFGPQGADVAAAVSPKNAPDATGFQLLELNGVKKDIAAQGRAGLLDTILRIKWLRKWGGFQSLSPNYIYKTQGTAAASDDPLLSSQWHYEQIDLAEAWAASDLTASGQRGAGVVVAVLDTGVALSHPDFVNADGSRQLTNTGFDFISDPDVAADGDGPDDDPDDPGDARTPGDSSFHGTHCAGTIAAATNNGEGAAGVAPNAKIMPIRVLGRGGGTLEDIRQGVLYAAGLENSSGQVPSEPADIISMSLGGPGSSDAMAAAVAAVNAEGVIVVAAAGNSNAPAELFSPAGIPGVITVSATDFNREKAFYSNFGSSNGTVDVAAPGGDTGADANLDGQPDGVVSLVFKNGGNTQYAAYQGTSMACPHVAGVAALMKSIWPEMGAQEFRNALPNITVDIGDPGEDPIFGHGLINANLAVTFAIEQSGEEVSLEPGLSVSTTILDFGGDVNSMLLAVGNTGQGDLTIDNVTVSDDWILLDAGGLQEGTNTISIQRAGLPAGVNTGSITIESNGGTEVISVRVFIGEQPTGGDVGIVYVLLVDPQTGEQRAQAATALDADYEFAIEDVPAGRYYLVAGTDLRDTFFLGNDGDVYGAFPLAQDPQLICRFVDDSGAPEGTPDCPELTEEQQQNPNLEDVIIPAQFLVDLGAREEETEDISMMSFSPQVRDGIAPLRAKRRKLLPEERP